MSKFKTAVLIPAYKRHEYTELCLSSIKDACDYSDTVFYLVDEGGNEKVMRDFARAHDVVSVHSHPQGLRNTIIEFFDWVKHKDFKYISKVDNDCIVPKNWLSDLTDILETTKCQIISPNVSESQAAYKYGKDDTYGLGFRPASCVGGLWTMQKSLTTDIFFERADTSGIRGAFALLKQIIKLNEPQPVIGWTEKVSFEDIGHWAGTHPNHIKSGEHFQYSTEVGRSVNWNVEAGN